MEASKDGQPSGYKPRANYTGFYDDIESANIGKWVSTTTEAGNVWNLRTATYQRANRRGYSIKTHIERLADGQVKFHVKKTEEA